MFPHLPEAIFWDVVKRTDDVKACVALWSSMSELFKMYDKQEFWKNMCHFHFGFNPTSSSIPHRVSWCDVYWWLYRNVKGCGYCSSAIPRPQKDGSMLVLPKDDPHSCVVTFDQTPFSIYVCKKCKNLLGDTVTHKDQIEPWKVSLIKRLRGHRCSNIFKNYFGENQIDRCQAYNMKCTGCLKNLKNARCLFDMCGTCCNCKYHKSHYDQATPGDIIVSFDVYSLIKTTGISLFNEHSKKNTRKKRPSQGHSVIVHRFSY